MGKDGGGREGGSKWEGGGDGFKLFFSSFFLFLFSSSKPKQNPKKTSWLT